MSQVPEGSPPPAAGRDMPSPTPVPVGAGLVLGATIAASAAESAAETADATRGARNIAPAPGRVVSLARSPRRRRPARLVRTAPQPRFPEESSVQAPAESAPAAPDDTRSELRDWVKENATLLSNASLLISISALALSVLPDAGFLNSYIKALIFGAALLLLAELHHQWPDDLRIHVFGRSGIPRNHSWRMTGFAILLQIATVLFALWATLNNPAILLPLAAFAVIIAFRTWYFRRFRGPWATVLGIIALVAVLLLAEVLSLVLWALISGQPVTLELFGENAFNLEVGE